MRMAHKPLLLASLPDLTYTKSSNTLVRPATNTPAECLFPCSSSSRGELDQRTTAMKREDCSQGYDQG